MAMVSASSTSHPAAAGALKLCGGRSGAGSWSGSREVRAVGARSLGYIRPSVMRESLAVAAQAGRARGRRLRQRGVGVPVNVGSRACAMRPGAMLVAAGECVAVVPWLWWLV